MKTKRFVATIMIVCSLVTLFGCGKTKVDESVQSVIQQIDSIGTVSLDSKEKIQSAISAYEALTDTQKSQVENIGKLDEMTAKLTSLEREHFLSSLDSYSFENVNELKNAMNEYWASLSDTEKETVLLAYAGCSVEKAVEKKIKTYLKSPNSFCLYDFSHGLITKIGNEYSTIAKIRFGATNSFGGEVTNNVDAIMVRFTIDIANMSVNFIDVSCSTFLKWELGL